MIILDPQIERQIERVKNGTMDRREFLAYGGAMLVGVVGVSSVVKAFLNTNKNQSKGYGGGAYGGSQHFRR